VTPPFGRRRVSRLAIAALVLAASATLVLAHEGHKSLPTKGASVEGDKVRLAPEARAAIGLKLADIDSQTLESLVRVNADVAIPPDRHAFASTRLDGRILSLAVRPGSVVQAGQELATMESLELLALGLELIQSRTQIEFLKKERERVASLVQKGLATEKEQLETETEWRSLEIRSDAARKRLLAVGLAEAEVDAAVAAGRPERTLRIRAPLAGVVTHADVEVGRFVESTDHLFEVADLSRVWIQGEVPEDLSGAVKEGVAVHASFSSYPGRVFTGTLERRAPTIDRRTSTLRVYAAFDNPDLALKPGMGGEMAIVAARVEDATVAPLGGITVEGGSAFAFVEAAEGVYQKKDLALGLRMGGVVEVRDGLFPGDKVVTDGKHQLAGLFALGVLKLSETARRNMGLETAEVDIRPVEDVVAAFGTAKIVTGQEVAATSRIHGKVRLVRANVGDRVEAGSALAELESLELEGLEIDLRREKLRLDLAETTRARFEHLAKEGIPAQRDLLKAERDVRERTNEVAGLLRRLEMLGDSKEKRERVLTTGETSPGYSIRTPIAGIVRARAAVPGQVVRPGDALLEIAAPAPIWLEIALPQETIARVPTGTAVRARCAAYPDRVFEGRVEATTHVLDEATRTLPVLVRVENQDLAMLPGMRCEAALIVSTATAVLAIPRAAVGMDGGRPFAVVEMPNGTFKQVPLELGRRDDRLVEVKKGLYPGDRVAVRGVEALRSALGSVK